MSSFLVQGTTPTEFLSEVRKIFKEELTKMNLQSNEHHDYLTVDEVCEQFKFLKSNLYKLTSRELIPVIKRGKQLLFNRKDVIAWLESKKTVSPPLSQKSNSKWKSDNI